MSCRVKRVLGCCWCGHCPNCVTLCQTPCTQPVLWYWLIKGYHTLPLSNGLAEQQIWEPGCIRGDKRAVNFSGHCDQLPFPQPPCPVSCQAMKCLRGSAPDIQMFQCPKSYNITRTATEILILIIQSRSSIIKVVLWMLFPQIQYIHTRSLCLNVLPALFPSFSLPQDGFSTLRQVFLHCCCVY